MEKYKMNESLKALYTERTELKDFSYEISRKFIQSGDYFKRPIHNKIKNHIKLVIKNTLSLYPKKVPIYTSKVIQSNSYIDLSNINCFEGVIIKRPIWESWQYDDKYLSLRKLKSFLNNNNINYFFSEDFLLLKNRIYDFLYSYYKQNVKALLVPYDLPFFEKKSIEIFTELERPNAVFLHGLPARYNNIDDNRADKLFVWGESIKKNYIDAGVACDKIIVTGHPAINDRIKINREKQNAKMESGNVLVVTKVAAGAISDSTINNIDHCINSYLYTELVKNALKKAGVKSAILRLHPSESIAWYKRVIDTKFYSFDNLNLETSLNNSSIVIGPASTVILNTLLVGKNYIVFEPHGSKKGYDLFNYKIVPPFDGSDKNIITTFSESELYEVLKGNLHIDSEAFLDCYMGREFKPDLIKDYFFEK